ncbi:MULTISPECIES: ABC-F family ATP-binding cassette domain-containing protein [Prosthecochloris]|uniref:ABC-F family ATP-binding cassette domain-containing protein n=1 Tax=Prosthecochloris vibrioformis TaxID=1098 RepID=A0A5C4S1N8_PROVB|nr:MULTISPECIES: ABC-F family ATP-binding cassette domain-containing protein [Prosthecochloris]ANT64536.1 putative ABC transporter ATP-binding protein [Prosthecochloris sp. CIB 2401]TNJ37374.1 ABC-F family ATP-binding cassette domain-containing protein [Prosthecochloris vibrioformis]
MVLLTVEGISKQYGLKELFRDVSFGIDEKDKVGIIGPNGCGKSTLLKILAGIEQPDSGKVMTTRQKRIAWLPQDSPYNPQDTILQAVLTGGDPLLRLVCDYEHACSELELDGGQTEALVEKVTALSHQLDTANGWEIESNVRAVLGKLGLHDPEKKMGALSGGQRKRVALAHALVMPSDALILDEPTNHLDADSVEWLEAYLRRYQGAILLVTHDRYFLDRMATRMIELDGHSSQVFTGGYSSYLQQKAEQEAEEARADRKRLALQKQELEWLRSGCKARTTKQKARIQRAEGLLEAPGRQEKKELDIGMQAERLGNMIIEFHHVSKAWNDTPLISGFDYIMQKGDRIGIIGPNGSGKTTLLEMVAGRLQPDTGSIEIGKTVRIGYYDQMSRGLDDSMRVIDYIKEEAENIKLKDGTMLSASKMLERFLFEPSVQYNRIGNLSGGERRRLYLLRQLIGSPNVLLLDEPTNDLDIPTLQVLEEFLDSWQGALITVSHDRYFLDRTVDYIFAFEEGGHIHRYPGNYSVYLDSRDVPQKVQKTSSKETPTAPKATAEPSKKKGQKLSYNERRELTQLEERIARNEARQQEIALELQSAADDYEIVQQLSQELQQLQSTLDTDLDRWATLEEKK